MTAPREGSSNSSRTDLGSTCDWKLDDCHMNEHSESGIYPVFTESRLPAEDVKLYGCFNGPPTRAGFLPALPTFTVFERESCCPRRQQHKIQSQRLLMLCQNSYHYETVGINKCIHVLYILAASPMLFTVSVSLQTVPNTGLSW